VCLGGFAGRKGEEFEDVVSYFEETSFIRKIEIQNTVIDPRRITFRRI